MSDNLAPHFTRVHYDAEPGVIFALNRMLFTDPDGPDDGLTFALVQPPDRGELAFTPDSASFTYYPEGYATQSPDDDATYLTSALFSISDGTDTTVQRIYIDVGTDTSPPVPAALFSAPGVADIARNGIGEGSLQFAGFTGTGEVSDVTISHGAQFEILSLAGDYEITPPADFEGTLQFAFTLRDDLYEARYFGTVTVGEPNDPPEPVDRLIETQEDVPISNAVLFATDPEGDDLTYALVTDTPAAAGSVTVTPDGFFDFTPTLDFNGTAMFTWSVTDGVSTREATGTITVTPVNDPPTATAATESIDDSGRQSFVLTGTDPEGDALTFAFVSEAVHGILEPAEDFATSGAFHYTPDEIIGERVEELVFRVSDGEYDREATFTIIVAGTPNQPPVAQSPTITIPEGDVEFVTYDIEASDPDGHALTFEIDGAGARALGTLTPAADFETSGTFTYTFGDNASGTDVVEFEVIDELGARTPGSFTIEITAVNEQPRADGGSFTGVEDQTITDTLTGFDPDGDRLTFSVGEDPSHGTLTLDPDTGGFTYEPEENFNGTDSFEYLVDDGELPSDPATVTLEIAAVNDPPVSGPYGVTIRAGETLRLPLGATDPDGDDVGFSDPASSDGTADIEGDDLLVFTPAEGVSEATVTYLYSDGGLEDYLGTVTVTVLPPANRAPEAIDLVVTSEEELTVNGRVVAPDPDGDAVSFSVPEGRGPQNGTVVMNEDGFFDYTPDRDFFGTDTFTFRASDGELTDEGVVTITVENVNDPPEARFGLAQVPEDTGALGSLGPPLTSDPDGDDLSYEIIGGPSSGVIEGFDPETGEFIYRPDRNYNGTDLIDYRVTDPSGASDVESVRIEVLSRNDPPEPGDDSFRAEHGAAFDGQVTATDADGDALTFAGTDFVGGTGRMQPDGSFVFTPGTGFLGTAQVLYTVTDGRSTPVEGAAPIEVFSDENLPPVAPDARIVIAEDSGEFTDSLLVPVQGLEEGRPFDPEGGPLVFTSTLNPGGEEDFVAGAGWPTRLRIAEDGTVALRPFEHGNGTFQYPYTVTDDRGQTATGTLTIVVEPVNDAPVVLPAPHAQADEDSTPFLVPVARLAFDIDGDDLEILSIGGASGGSAMIDAMGTGVIFTPGPEFSGTAGFDFTVSDGAGGTEEGRAEILLREINDPPIAGSYFRTAQTGDQAFVPYRALLELASDIDSRLTLDSIVKSATAANGAVEPLATGFRFTPFEDAGAVARFTYVVDDGEGGTAQGSVLIGYTDDEVRPEWKSAHLTGTAKNQAHELALPRYDDTDGDALTYQAALDDAPSRGELTFDEDGTITYTPYTDVSGTDTFTILVSDGSETVRKQVTVTISDAGTGIRLGASSGGEPWTPDGPLQSDLTEFADTLSLSDGDDRARAKGGDDTIRGKAGADVIDGGTGDDTIDGGEGDDVSLHSGPRSAYTIGIGPDGVTVEDRRADSDGTDWLTGVEDLAFSDGVWELDRFDEAANIPQEDLARLIELYIAHYNRFADSEGLWFWATAFVRGVELDAIAGLFFGQEETQQEFGFGPDTAASGALDPALVGQIVSTVYRNVLGRDGDPLGVEFWTAALESGSVSLSQFIVAVLEGARAPTPDDATDAFKAQKAADVAYLDTKIALGLYGAGYLGLNDVETMRQAGDLFDGSSGSVAAVRALLDLDHTETLDSELGGVLIPLIGLPDPLEGMEAP